MSKETQTVYTMDPPTFAEGFSCTLTALGGAFPRFTRRGTKNGLRRRQIVISNRDNDVALRVIVNQSADAPSGADEDYAVLVFPRTNVTLFTDSTVQIVNVAGSSIPVSVCEIFYRDP
jgi:hypothetical protein